MAIRSCRLHADIVSVPVIDMRIKCNLDMQTGTPCTVWVIPEYCQPAPERGQMLGGFLIGLGVLAR